MLRELRRPSGAVAPGGRTFEMPLFDTKAELKALIVKELNLRGRDPSTIEDDAPLFGEGLGLDSLDALQLAMSIEERFGVRIPEGQEARPIFRSVTALAEFVEAQKGATREGA
jgi:acyl carrier protein